MSPRGPAPERAPPGRRRCESPGWLPFASLLAAVLGLLGGCHSSPHRQPRVAAMGLQDLEAYVELAASWRGRKENFKNGGGESNTRELIVEERLGIDADTYFYHPNIARLTAFGLVALQQYHFDYDASQEAGDDDFDFRENRWRFEYDVNLRLMEGKSYPAAFFARQRRNWIRQTFFETVEQTSLEHGVTWQHVDDTLPVDLQVMRRDVRYDERAGPDTYWPDREEEIARLDAGYNITDFNQFSLDCEYREIDDEFVSQTDISDLALSHFLGFGSEKASRLDSEVRYYDQSGSLPQERLEWREDLRLQHLDSLRSWYGGQIVRTEQEDSGSTYSSEETNYRLSAGAEHQLYQSLVSRVDGSAQRQNLEDTKVDRRRLGGDLRYTKKNPWGVLDAGYTITFDTMKVKGGSGLVRVTDDRRTFVDPNPVVLDSPAIVLSSIVITDESRTFVYVEGVDYSVVRFAGQVEIHRLASGRISNGQTVLISYTVAVTDSPDLDTFAQRFEIKQTFEFGLFPYYRLEWQDQSLSPKNATITVAEDFRVNVFGLGFHKDALRLRAEYEDHDSSTSPFTAFRADGAYSYRFAFGGLASASANWSQVDYETEQNRDTTYLTAQAAYSQTLARSLQTNATFKYLKIRDTIDRNEQGVDADLTVTWRVRQTELSLTYQYGWFDSRTNRSQSSWVYLQMRRDF